MLTICDSVALKILNETTLIAGVGNEIRVFSDDITCTLPFKLKGKVHGIESEESSDKILIYGENEFVLLVKSQNSFQLLYRGALSDWISSGKILDEPNSFLIVTAHSVAILFKYDDQTQTSAIEEKVSCTDKSTLYCSYVYGRTWDQCLVLGGNAFGELLIWQPSVRTDHNRAKLLHRIPGHNGVIFSIDVDMESKLLVTTSDDRSIRFWDITVVSDFEGIIDFEKSSFIPRKSGYSHVARVFKGKIVHEDGETFAITGGEDSYICLWNKNCELLFKRRQQFGATIWNLDYHNATKTLFTAGSSGNLLQYGLQDCFTENKTASSVLGSQTLCSGEYVAKVKFLSDRSIVGITNKSRLMHRVGFHDADWVEIKCFDSVKCTVLDVYDEYVVVGGYQRVSLFKFMDNSSNFERVYHGLVLPGVVRSFIFLSNKEFLISDEGGNCKLIKGCNFDELVSVDLPQCKERWVTAACRVNNDFLVISNRQGSLMLYSISENGKSSKLCDTIKRLHGHLGATTITCVKYEAEYCVLKTTGHDSTIKTIKLDTKDRSLRVLSRSAVPIAWVERAVMNEENNVELIFGFNDNHFVLWSSDQDTHFEIPCGGGHRCWDLHLQLSENRASMVFIKNKQVFLHLKRIFNKPTMHLDIPRNNWHVRPCNVLSSFLGEEMFLVSAGDDNLLKIFKFDSLHRTLIQLHEICAHISNIRGLRVQSVGSKRHLIFSCGGRAQICVNAFDEESQMVEELIDYSIQKEKPSQSIRFDPETRVMSLDVRQTSRDADSFEIFAGCSDGYVRRFLMHLKNSNFSLISENYYGRCVLQVRLIADYLLTIATDGVVCFWPLDLSGVNFKVAHHDSGVNSFDVRLGNESEFHLLTGGDDQQVVYSKVICRTENEFEVKTLHRMDYLHTAQVTAVRFSPCMLYFYSSSVDQVIRKVNLETLTSDWDMFSCVADVKGVDVIKDCHSSKLIAFLYGCGLQVIDLSKCSLVK